MTYPLLTALLDFDVLQRGPPDSVYEGGEYHGLIMFPGGCCVSSKDGRHAPLQSC